MYTVSDLAKIKNKSRMNILNTFRRKGLLAKAHLFKRKDGYKEYAWADEFKSEVETVLKITKEEVEKYLAEKAEEKKPIDEKGMTLEERMKLHPLVTNPLFFKISYFPDVRLSDDEEEGGGK